MVCALQVETLSQRNLRFCSPFGDSEQWIALIKATVTLTSLWSNSTRWSVNLISGILLRYRGKKSEIIYSETTMIRLSRPSKLVKRLSRHDGQLQRFNQVKRQYPLLGHMKLVPEKTPNGWTSYDMPRRSVIREESPYEAQSSVRGIVACTRSPIPYWLYGRSGKIAGRNIAGPDMLSQVPHSF